MVQKNQIVDKTDDRILITVGDFMNFFFYNDTFFCSILNLFHKSNKILHAQAKCSVTN